MTRSQGSMLDLQNMYGIPLADYSPVIASTGRPVSSAIWAAEKPAAFRFTAISRCFFSAPSASPSSRATARLFDSSCDHFIALEFRGHHFRVRDKLCVFFGGFVHFRDFRSYMFDHGNPPSQVYP